MQLYHTILYNDVIHSWASTSSSFLAKDTARHLHGQESKGSSSRKLALPPAEKQLLLLILFGVSDQFQGFIE